MGHLIVKDHGWNKLKADLEKLARGESYVKVGMVGEKAAKVEPEHAAAGGEPLTNVKLAAIHEFGAPERGIPERSFLRSTFSTHRAEYQDLLKKAAAEIMSGKRKTSIRKMLSAIGFKAKWDVKDAILKGTGIPPPNAQATIDAKNRKGAWNKGSKLRDRSGKFSRTGDSSGPRTLVDTTVMVKAIDHAVVISGEAPEPNAGEKE